ncbi:MAG: Fic family protein [Selenomonas sp.]|nr:Fic family protein [Selenomonas sp.]
MPYESLYHIYYKTPSVWDKEYHQRFNSSAARHLPISISQYGRQQQHPAFFCYTEEIALLQDKIMDNFRQFIQTVSSLPAAAMPLYLHTSLIEEIKSTNDIEGVRSTRKEIVDAMNHPADERHNLRLGSLVNQYENIIAGQKLCLTSSQDIRCLFDAFIADEIKRENPHNLPDGNIFRRDSVDIVSASQKTVHRGLYPESKIISCMDSALTILHDESIPIFIRIAIFHYLFGYIHPFYDGNGRLSRFITAYYLTQKLHPAIAINLSVLIKNQRSKYYKLFTITDADYNRGDLTPFIIGMLEFTMEALQNTTKTLQEKLAAYENSLPQLSKLPLPGKTTISLCNLLLQGTTFSPYGLSMKDLQKYLGKSENTIYTHLKKIPAELLIVDSRTKNYLYSLRIF